MVAGLLVLLVCQAVGEVLVRSTGTPLPGPVAGLVVFFGVLLLRRPDPASPLVRGSDALLGWLPLLYVPAGVGVVAHLSTLRDDLGAVVTALVLSWLAGLVVTAGVMKVAFRVTSRQGTQ